MPEIRVLHLLDGARKASGLTVVIDVFRAFSVAPLAIRQGAVWIHPVATPEEALAIRVRNPDWLLMGERDGRPLPGFELRVAEGGEADGVAAGELEHDRGRHRDENEGGIDGAGLGQAEGQHVDARLP